MRTAYLLLAGATIALVPAVTGLSGNASFSETQPIRIPAVASTTSPVVDDHGGDRPRTATSTGVGDDHGGDRPRTSTSTEAGDDHGGDRPRASTSTEAGDDHGGDRPRTSASAEAGDDHGGGDSTSGSDDSGHGGSDG